MKQYFLLSLLLISLSTNIVFSQSAVDYGNPVEYTIGGITVTGTSILDKNALISLSGLAVGQTIKVPGQEITRALKKLWKQGILGDVAINVSGVEGDKVYLEIALTERPRLSRYFFPTTPKGQQETIGDKVTLVRGQVVTDAMIKNAKVRLRNHYIEKGFRNVEIKVVQQKDSILANSVYLDIYIDKKKKTKINDIELVGVNAFQEKKIRKKLKKTKEKRFGRIFSPSKMVDEKYEEDKDNLVAFYNKNGYRNMKIDQDSIWNHDDETVNVYLKIDEGNKFFYRNITWTGNYVYPDSILSRILGIQKGDVFNPEEMSKRLSFNPTGTDINGLYMDDGYLFFSIDPVEVMVENDSIDIEMRIFEGEQATIRNIIVNGNTKTSDHVIFREIRTIPGQKFSRSDLIRTQRELATLGYFDPEQIGINPKPNMNDGTVDIEYTLVERPSDQIELSGGWGGQFGFVGTLGVVFNNFSLRKAGDLSAWKPLPSGDGQRLAIRMQANGRRFQTYSLTFTEPWLGGRKRNSLSLNLSHSISRIIDVFNNVSGTFKISGATLGLGRQLTFPDDYFVMQNSLGFLQYNLDNYNLRGFGTFNSGKSYSVTLNTTISRNSINNPTFPRTGSSVSLNVSLTPPYSQVSNAAVFQKDDPNTQFKWVEYHKWMFDNSWFTPVVGKLVLNTRVNMGFLGSYGGADISPFERFILGGDGLAQQNFGIGQDIIGLRGYQNNSITPPVPGVSSSNTQGGTIYNKFVMELRYPISLNPSATIFVLGFMEYGNNWDKFRNYNPFNMYRSAGVGARIFMPAFGLLGIDWGYGFDEVIGNPGVGGAQFHFTIGQQIR
jgi:outer membrane protein insertion porin family